MLDQSFSTANFRKIFDYENRKGVNLDELFPEVRKITGQLKKCNEEIKEAKRKNKSKKEIDKKYEKKKKIREKREKKLETELEKISENLLQKDFRIRLKKIEILGKKPMYTVEKSAECYFVMKQLQYNLYRLYKVKQSNRSSIVNNFLNLLKDQFPKFVIRVDMESFYESIPQDKLIKKISEDGSATFFSQKTIKQILSDYKVKACTNKGVPRGIGISACLSEIYLRKIDRRIKEIPNLIYYARYVDDIIAIFIPFSGETEDDYAQDKLEQIKKIIRENDLAVNEDKTTWFNLSQDNHKPLQLDYLGYAISLMKDGTFDVELTDKKIRKYKKKINAVFGTYYRNRITNEKESRRWLAKRIRFITGNTRLKNNKSNILVGIYYSNKNLTNLKALDLLDRHLRQKIKELPKAIREQKRIIDCSFREGFEKQRFSPFSSKELKNIVSIFKNIR